MELRRVAVELVRARRSLLAFALLVPVAGIALPSCGGGGSGTKEVCTPGETQACICTNGSTGAQSCAADGTQFGACTCAPAGTGGTTSTGGTSGTGGSAGGTGSTVAACPTARVCEAACCGTDEVCIVEAGVTRCAQSCTTSSECTVAMPCCSLLAPANGGSPPAKGACTSDVAACRCTTGRQCQSGSCSPALAADGTTPLGVNTCSANDGTPYDGCNGSQSCAGNTCCVHDTNGNSFCAVICGNGTMCTGGAQCSNAYSIDFLSSCSTTQKTCSP
jgi:hypothetical protein